jgi:hypothetical protein
MTIAARSRPDSTEYASHYAGYVAGVPEGDVVATLRDGGRELLSAIADIAESRGGFRYADGKWTIREVVGHVIDAERVFAYRALRIARGDTTPLAAFDEDAYARTAGSDQRTLADLAEELRAVRESTVALFASLPDEAWTRSGTASGKTVSVRALAYIAAGHARHHLVILRERYLAH